MVEPSGKKVLVELVFSSGGVARLGTAARNSEGWRFFPAQAGRRPSRKSWPTLEACLPAWVGYPDACQTREI